jgi:glycine reductase
MMRLEVGRFGVREVRLGNRTALHDGVLSVDRRALVAHLLEDPRLTDVGVGIARPGDSIRIIHILDTVEPRVKVSGGSDFPGIMGPPDLTGSGRTNRLEGVAVLGTGNIPGATDSQGL